MNYQKQCEVCAVLPSNKPLFETDYWVVSLSSDQGYLGRCFVTLKEHKGDMADLTNEEWLDFAEVVKKLEAAIRGAFGARLFNWACLMNNAFQAQPAFPHIHWHVRPRYDAPVAVDDEVFNDSAFGHHYDRDQKKIASPRLIDAIQSKIVANL